MSDFVWTDALVAEYSLTNQKMTLFEFKRFVQEREEKTKRDSLFITEDGVEIFDGKINVFPLLTEDNWRWWSMAVEDVLKVNTISPNAKFFSTKEKAEEYILMNKPCLSINELKEIIGKRDWIGRDFFIELAKAKRSK